MPNTHDTHQSSTGVLLAMGAFSIWGLSPIYFKSLLAVPALEIVLHRMLWSFVFLLPVVVAVRQWSEFKRVIANRRTMLILALTAVLVSTNWFVFIWAVNNDHILEASLGYYINPLINVLLGMVFLKERLRRPQGVAVVLALVGVLYLSMQVGKLPWISLTLAMSFALYGLIRKVAPVNSLVGLTVEAMMLSLPAAAYLVYLDIDGRGAFLDSGFGIDLLLICAGLVTAVPLLLFTAGARRLHLSTVGILQYIAPSGNFLLALWVYDEPMKGAQMLTFAMIWTALAIYSVDSVRDYRRRRTSAMGQSSGIDSALPSSADSDR